MLGSVLPACDRIGVSTSSTSRAAKKSRMAALRRARRRSASTPAEGFQQDSVMRLQELQQPGLVPDLDAELFGFGQLGTGGFTGNDERGLLRHAAGGLGAERLQPLLRLVAGHRLQ